MNKGKMLLPWYRKLSFRIFGKRIQFEDLDNLVYWEGYKLGQTLWITKVKEL